MTSVILFEIAERTHCHFVVVEIVVVDLVPVVDIALVDVVDVTGVVVGGGG